MNMMDEIRKYTKEDFVILYELEDYYQNLGNLQDIAEVILMMKMTCRKPASTKTVIKVGIT